MTERHETPAERADRNWGELLQELRVSQTGVQLLTAFLLSLPLQQRFTQLTTSQRTVYLLAVCLSILATGLLVAPVAVHRAVFRHHEKTALVTVGDRAARAGLAVLALAVSDVLALIFSIVVGTAAAVVGGLLSVALLALLWWWLPQQVMRHGRPGEDGVRSVGQEVE
jgi:hypothetical protein